MSDNLVQVYSIYIKAPAEKVWSGITQSEYTQQWGYGGATELDPTPGGVYRNLSTPAMREMGLGDVAIEGTVVEADPPNKLVVEWKAMWYPDSPPTLLTWELTQYGEGLTRVVLTHDVTAYPALAGEIAGAMDGGDPGTGGGGWPWSLSDLKTLLESGTSMSADAA